MTAPMTIPDEAVRAAQEATEGGFGITDDYMRRALTAALPFLQGVKVKKLEWGESRGRWFHKSMAPRYEVIGGAIGDFVLQYNCQDLSRHPTVEAAKAAAQADYEARILSALEPFANSYPQGANLAAHSKNENGPDHEPSPRAQALEEAAKIAFDVSVNGEYHGEASADSTSSIYQQGAFEVYEAIRALSSQPVEDGLPQDVINLVIAAREAWETWQLPEEEFKRLDAALEAFASRVPYENEPDDLPASPGASE